MKGSTLLLLPLLLLVQQRDAAPAAPQAIGTGEIAGVVMSAEAVPQPLRRAVVTLSGSIANARSVMTDDAGRFTFRQLPAGTFSVTARKAAYLAAPYGARKPGRAGTSIALINGQRADVTITMFRGAAISGALRDSAGQPVGGVDVRVIDARTLLTVLDSSPPQLATTDDRGIYRMYGLLPGDYFIVALPAPGGQGEITAPASSDNDAALARLAARNGPAAPAPTAPVAPPKSRPVGYAPIFFPGTPNYTEAARVQIGLGEERSGIDFQLTHVPTASIDARVSGDVPIANVQVTLFPTGPNVSTMMSSNSLAGKPMDAEGRLRYSNLPPGQYKLVARARLGDLQAPTTPTVLNGTVIGRGGSLPAAAMSPSSTNGNYLYGIADVELRGEDVLDVNLPLQPGGLISGRIVFNATGTTPKPDDLTKIRATMTFDGGGGMVSSNGLTMGNSLVMQSISSVKADGTFEIRGIGPGRFNLTTTLPPEVSKGWLVRSARSGDRDLLDEPIEMVPGLEIRNVTITLADVHTELSGTLQLASGQPTTEYYIVAFPADRSLWKTKTRRILSTRPATDGHFVFADLPAGEYLIAALTDLDPLDLMERTLLEQLAPLAVKVAVAEGEKKVQDLRIR